MRYPRILSAIRTARWAATPATLQAITDVLGAHLRGHVSVSMRALPRADDPAPDEHDSESDSAAADPIAQPVGRVALIRVYGILGKHLSSMETDCGGCDVDAIAAALDVATGDSNVSAIVLDFDSPGGVVTGVPELAAKIRRADAVKPVYAFTASQCCSGAYWLAAACRAVYCTRSADLGSIGVYVALVDESEWWRKEGYKLDLIKAGEFKAAGIAGSSLTPAERALFQADVDAIYAMFTADILANRAVAPETMQGQTFLGAAAVAANLADDLVDDLPALLARLPA